MSFCPAEMIPDAETLLLSEKSAEEIRLELLAKREESQKPVGTPEPTVDPEKGEPKKEVSADDLMRCMESWS